jgi:arylsulfatase A-like enzyme
VSEADRHSERRLSALWLVELGLALGLAYGLVEGMAFVAAGLVPGVLSWRSANAAPALFVAPLVYGPSFAALGLVLGSAGRGLGRKTADRWLVFACTSVGGYLLFSLPGQFLTWWACAVLGLGVGVVASRTYAPFRDAASVASRRALPWLAGTVVLACAVTLGLPALKEWHTVSGLPSPRPGSPNILLLVIDTERSDHLSVYGYGRRTSPGLERFAAQGVVFETAVASSSWTLPTHATLMTGRPQREHRAGKIRRPYLDRRFPTLAEALTARGYATGGFVGNTFWCGRQTGLARGFVHYEDFFGNLGDALARTVAGRQVAYTVLPRFARPHIPGRKWASQLNRDVLSWLDRRRGRPFFVFVNYLDVHPPLQPPAPFAGRFRETASPGERSGVVDLGAPALLAGPGALAALPDRISRYDESMLYLDNELDRLFGELGRRGLLDSTLVIVTSDHGESWGEHGFLGHGHSLYRDQILVPLIVRWPGHVAGGGRERRAVGLDQVAATIAAAAGLPDSAFPGRSLLDTASASEAALAELARRWPVAGNWPSSRTTLTALVTEQWHYIQPDSGDVELYAYVADPEERVNLAARPESAALVARFRGEVEKRRRPHGDAAGPPAAGARRAAH